MNLSKIAAMAVIAASFASAANAVTYRWTWSSATHVEGAQPGGGYLGYSNGGGNIESIETTYNNVTKNLTYDVLFKQTDHNDPKTSGYWLAMNSGPNPKGIAGELALLYFDASSSSQPVLSAYGYNGINGDDSYKDGKPNPGIQAPDFILSSKTNSSWINNLQVIDAGETRRMKFDINATAINMRTPLYGTAADWTGAQFNNKFGVWFHPVKGLQTSYDSAGKLTSFGYSSQGYLDGSDMEAVPEPATMAVLGAGLAMIARRRKNA